jgi:quercetin dioxygenase-like cupin family protein
MIELPTTSGVGAPREVAVLVDEPALKLVSIILRAGTVLGEHQAPIPVTIQALEGAGTVVVGTERLRLDRGHAVVLAAGVAHSVEPDAGSDLILLVHHLGQGEETHP